MNSKFSGIIILSILVESIITYFQKFFENGNLSSNMILSIILGIVIAMAYELDLPKIMGFDSKWKFIGNILTGIIISRGSNYIYDILQSISNLHLN